MILPGSLLKKKIQEKLVFNERFVTDCTTKKAYILLNVICR